MTNKTRTLSTTGGNTEGGITSSYELQDGVQIKVKNSPEVGSTTAYSRRTFLKASSAAVAGLAVASPAFAQGKSETLAINGGEKALASERDTPCVAGVASTQRTITIAKKCQS